MLRGTYLALLIFDTVGLLDMKYAGQELGPLLQPEPWASGQASATAGFISATAER
jgi:hypothetical protein